MKKKLSVEYLVSFSTEFPTIEREKRTNKQEKNQQYGKLLSQIEQRSCEKKNRKKY